LGSGHAGFFILFLFFRHASEHTLTSSQFLAQDFRQVISRPQTVQGLLGRCCLLPLNSDFMKQPVRRLAVVQA